MSTNLFYAKKNGISVLGIELWRFFTIVTFIVTVSTSLLWFDNLIPTSQAEEFLAIDQAKSRIKELVISSQAVPIASYYDLVPYTFTRSACYSDIEKVTIDFKKHNDTSSLLSTYQNEIQSTYQVLIQQSNINFINTNQIQDFYKVGAETQKQFKIKNDNITEYNKALLLIQKQLSLLCSANVNNLAIELEAYTHILEIFEAQYHDMAWLEDQYKLVRTTARIVDVNKTNNIISTEEIEKVSQEMQHAFTAVYFEAPKLFTQVYEEPNLEMFNTALLKLEQWQNKQLSDYANNKISHKIVWSDPSVDRCFFIFIYCIPV
jgi:hypothetical protein